jgi:hypothetical protein
LDLLGELAGVSEDEGLTLAELGVELAQGSNSKRSLTLMECDEDEWVRFVLEGASELMREGSVFELQGFSTRRG